MTIIISEGGALRMPLLSAWVWYFSLATRRGRLHTPGPLEGS
jgi:hypothetical protein